MAAASLSSLISVRVVRLECPNWLPDLLWRSQSVHDKVPAYAQDTEKAACSLFEGLNNRVIPQIEGFRNMFGSSYIT